MLTMNFKLFWSLIVKLRFRMVKRLNRVQHSNEKAVAKGHGEESGNSSLTNCNGRADDQNQHFARKKEEFRVFVLGLR